MTNEEDSQEGLKPAQRTHSGRPRSADANMKGEERSSSFLMLATRASSAYSSMRTCSADTKGIETPCPEPDCQTLETPTNCTRGP